MLETIITYASIWAPSLVAVLGTVALILAAIGKVKDAYDKLNKDEILKEVKAKLETVACENQELIRCNKLLIDELTKIKGYADAIKEKK